MQLPARPRIQKLDRYWRVATLPFLLFILIPLAALFLRISPQELVLQLGSTQLLQAIRVSFSTALITTLLAIVFGLPVAYLLTLPTSRFQRMLDALIDLPTVLPPAVAGVALLIAFGRNGLFGPFFTSLGWSIPFTTTAVVMAQFFVAAPLFVRAASIGLAAIDPELKQAAALDGASRWQIFHMVIIPIAWTAIVSGAVMTWARALGEFGATIIFAGNFPGRTQTMPLAIYLGFETNLDIALALSIVLIVISFLSMLVVKGVFNKRF
ncbi:MAG: molybdate ABC transporter permease subunit [Chloroflexi bacterium HGW-Chloroflexi-10]|nr:MAG: molybdate ABC transporter permease subunit [Chloroflexi bacterium HGW-Chloroflexi-10]